MTRKITLLGSLVIAALSVAATPASAVTISATETIVDGQPFDIFNRDLTRTRTNSNGFSQTETNDSTITSDNQIDGDFGVLNYSQVSYRHDLTWLNPAALNYLTASLQIEAAGSSNSDEHVLIDTIDIGVLNNGIFSTTVFYASNPVTLNVLFADGFLNVVINKNTSGGLAALVPVSVYSSTLTVRYEGGDNGVPEPASFGLLGLGVLGLVAKKLKK